MLNRMIRVGFPPLQGFKSLVDVALLGTWAVLGMVGIVGLKNVLGSLFLTKISYLYAQFGYHSVF